ncbi:unnamed protein product [Durusdinium trenchii]|uniref:Uncharacterized protein n=1 Tax=Durusdinium trenchii TaxID=1381693 RepID=A0ABP0N377_9DINO
MAELQGVQPSTEDAPRERAGPSFAEEDAGAKATKSARDLSEKRKAFGRRSGSRLSDQSALRLKALETQKSFRRPHFWVLAFGWFLAFCSGMARGPEVTGERRSPARGRSNGRCTEPGHLSGAFLRCRLLYVRIADRQEPGPLRWEGLYGVALVRSLL